MTATLEDETEQVSSWRCEALFAAGVDRLVADVLSRGSANLHVMAEAKLAGCSDELLVRIFGES